MRRLSMALLSVGILLGGCDTLTELLERGADAVGEAGNSAVTANLSEDDKLHLKLQSYVGCINGPSSRVLDAADRYASWVDIEKGVTGEEANVYGIYDHELDTQCLEGLAAAEKSEPDDPKLEAAANAWAEAYRAVAPLIHDAHQYYDREDYEDDGFAKGKAMHEGLAKAIGRFQDADQALRKVVSEKNDALQARRLEQLEKEEGRKLRFQQANVMAKAKVLHAAGDATSLDALDLPGLEQALTDYEAALEEADAYVEAHEAEADTVLLFDSFVDTGKDFLMAGKELMRRRRDGRAYTKTEQTRLGTSAGWMVEGSPDKLSRAYNDLVNRSNGLNWMNYDPNP